MLRPERQNLLVLLRDYVQDLSTMDWNSNDTAAKSLSEHLDFPDIIVEVIRIKEISNKVWKLEIPLFVL